MLKENFNSNQVILIEEVNKGRLVKTSEILYLEADDNYCRIFLTGKEKILVTKSLKSYEDELSPNIFFRCHKSYLVNISHIKEYVIGRNESKIILNDTTSIQVARRRACELKRFLQIQLCRLPVS